MFEIGYDLINESNIGTNNRSYTWAQMRSFAIDGANKVHAAAPGTQVSMSTQWYAFGDQGNHPSWYGGLGLDFYDYHEYSDTPNNLPTKPSWLEKPLLLGEYGPNTWTEANMNSVGDLYIQRARDRGYAGTMAWGYYQNSNDPMNIAWTAGGNQSWKNLGWTIQWYGGQFGTG